LGGQVERANPVFEVQVGRRRFKVRARRVPNPESSEMVSRYLDEHILYAKGIALMMGIDTKGMTDEELRSMFQTEMVLPVRPATEDADIR
jgi:hypothetical protein